MRTSRVDQVAAAPQKTMLLRQKGVALGGNPGQGASYKFNRLNAIKPDMITQATRNARAAAGRFAADSGCMVGSIRQAHQGVFTILAADQGSKSDEGGGEYGPGAFASDSSTVTTIQVVITVRYCLDK